MCPSEAFKARVEDICDDLMIAQDELESCLTSEFDEFTELELSYESICKAAIAVTELQISVLNSRIRDLQPIGESSRLKHAHTLLRSVERELTGHVDTLRRVSSLTRESRLAIESAHVALTKEVQEIEASSRRLAADRAARERRSNSKPARSGALAPRPRQEGNGSFVVDVVLKEVRRTSPGDVIVGVDGTLEITSTAVTIRVADGRVFQHVRAFKRRGHPTEVLMRFDPPHDNISLVRVHLKTGTTDGLNLHAV